MKVNKIVSCLIVLLLVLTLFNFLTFQSSAKPEAPDGEDANIFQKIFAALLGLKWYNIGAGPYAKYFYADPSVVEIDYLGNVSTDLVWGTEREERRNYHRFQPQVFPEFTLIYEAIFPPEIPEGAFRVVFDPPTFDVRDYHDFWGPQQDSGAIPKESVAQATINMTLFLDLPANPENAIQDFVLKINVSIYRKYGNLIKEFKLFAFLGGFWKVNYEADIGHKSFDLFVKVAPYRDAEIVSVSPPIEMRPNDVQTAQIQVQNRGSHIEEFGFKVNGAGETLFVNTPSPITLSPGEIRTIDVGLITKPLAYDRGTLHTVSVNMYPVDTPNITVATGDLTIRTKGLALQSIFRFRFSWHIFFTLSTIIFLLIIFGIYRRIRIRKLKQKPKKPWTLPDKKQHLEQLLKENKKQQYTTEINQLKKEYNLVVIKHKKEIKNELKQQRKQTILYRPIKFLNTLFKSRKKSVKKEQVYAKKIIPKTPKIKPIKSKKKNDINTKTKTIIPTDIQKQHILDKIKKQQQQLSK